MMRTSTIEAEIGIAKFIGEELPQITKSPKATPTRYETRSRKADVPKSTLCFYQPSIPMSSIKEDCKNEVLNSHIKSLAYLESTA